MRPITDLVVTYERTTGVWATVDNLGVALLRTQGQIGSEPIVEPASVTVVVPAGVGDMSTANYQSLTSESFERARSV